MLLSNVYSFMCYLSLLIFCLLRLIQLFRLSSFGRSCGRKVSAVKARRTRALARDPHQTATNRTSGRTAAWRTTTRHRIKRSSTPPIRQSTAFQFRRTRFSEKRLTKRQKTTRFGCPLARTTRRNFAYRCRADRTTRDSIRARARPLTSRS